MSAPERTGGSRSTIAQLTDMRSTAAVLDRVGNDIRGACGRLVNAMVALPPTAAAFAPLHSAELASDQAWLLYRPSGLLATGVEVEVIARALRGAADAYQRGDAAVRTTLRTIKIATAPQRVGLLVLRSGADATVSAVRSFDPRTDPRLVTVHVTRATIAWGVAFADSLPRELVGDPAATDAAVLLAQAGMWHLDPSTPPSLEAQSAALVRHARMLRLLKDDIPLTVTAVRPHDRPTHAPRAVGDVIRSIDSLESNAASAGNTKSRIRVRHVRTPSGEQAWIVEVPGTQDWSPTAPRNPSDITANLASVAGLPSSLYPAIEKALRTSMARAGVKPGSEPVMLAGHSQGGIVATRLAQDRRFRQTYRVTHVITAGSPVSRIPLPPAVKSLDFAHRTDPVPRLDTQDAPDAINRYGVTGDAAPKDGDTDDPIATHEASRYAASADTWAPRDSCDTDVRDFYDSPFFEGKEQSVDDYHMQRPGS